MRSVLVCILALLASSIFSDAPKACSCPRHPTAERMLNGSAAVFTGVAQSSVKAARTRSITTFRVIESFKGLAVSSTVRVLHPSGSSASCGVKFSVGKTYTLAVHHADTKPHLSTSLCSTWMFTPRVGLGPGLIRRMREIRGTNNSTTSKPSTDLGLEKLEDLKPLK